MKPDTELLTVAVVTFAVLAVWSLVADRKYKQHLAAVRDRAELRRRMLARVGLCDECGGSPTSVEESKG